MIRHFGVLIPSTNTTVETECRLLPPAYQAHIGRLMTSTPGQTFSPSRDEDIDYQSRLLGTAKVELVILAQTSASLFADDYDEVVTQRMSAGAGVPAITSAQAIGRALCALRARRIAIVSPYSAAVNERAARYFEIKHGLETVALEGFGATDSYAIGNLGPENARDAFARIVLGPGAGRSLLRLQREHLPRRDRVALIAGDPRHPLLVADHQRGRDASESPLSGALAPDQSAIAW